MSPPARRRPKGPGWPEKATAVARALATVPAEARPHLELTATDGPGGQTRTYTVRLSIGTMQLGVLRVRRRVQ